MREGSFVVLGHEVDIVEQGIDLMLVLVLQVYQRPVLAMKA